ncbi:hypothetical protein DCCM_4473 [Desulfocucumis palustris]|uniref:Uncharacterized protein n=1 Tax=Desulfocucumis palustris TaxID=1898651 RepID=A0A2L2XGU6_9FIRM|nr:hypothetical protein DCCM_4473 [Desulfocucumis palustris]
MEQGQGGKGQKDRGGLTGRGCAYFFFNGAIRQAIIKGATHQSAPF